MILHRFAARLKSGPGVGVRLEAKSASQAALYGKFSPMSATGVKQPLNESISAASI